MLGFGIFRPLPEGGLFRFEQILLFFRQMGNRLEGGGGYRGCAALASNRGEPP